MKTLSNAAIDVLSSSLEVTGSHVRIVRALDRKLYVEVNAALDALGGTWNRKAKAHVFDNDPSDAIADVLVDGGFHDKKRDLQQFFTPPGLAKEVVARADVKGLLVLEPSAGEGALAYEALRQGAEKVTCIEKDALLIRDLQKGGLDALEGDFLVDGFFGVTWPRIVMNPPFTRQQDIAHVTRAFGLLAPGGKLVAIMSAGVEFRSDRKTNAFRELVASVGGTIERLPEGSFESSGTSVRTVIVEMTKGG